MKKVLILGGSCLVGYTLVKKFKEYNWSVSALTFQREVEEADETIHLDLSNAFSFNEIPDLSTFDLVINSLAITNVRSNETKSNEAFTLHVELSRYLARRSSKYVYISTVAVYSETLDDDKNVNISLTNCIQKQSFSVSLILVI